MEREPLERVIGYFPSPFPCWLARALRNAFFALFLAIPLGYETFVHGMRSDVSIWFQCFFSPGVVFELSRPQPRTFLDGLGRAFEIVPNGMIVNFIYYFLLAFGASLCLSSLPRGLFFRLK